MLACPIRPSCRLVLLVVALAASPVRGQIGDVIDAAAPVNRSMAGASVAAPLSPAGAIYWNPSTLAGLGRSELEAGAELLSVRSRLQSGIAPGVVPGVQPGGLFGTTSSDGGPYPLPTIALAYVPPDSPVALGLGVFSMSGFGVNYPGSLTNPVLTAPPPAGLGFGPIYSEYSVLQVTPAVAYRVTANLSVAVGASIDLASLRLDPGVIAAPDDANRDGFATYPTATHGRSAWGAGFTLGAYYHEEAWGLGASVRSPQWFEALQFNSRDELGRPQGLRFNLDQPLIASVGGAYTGLDRWVFDVDVRYLDFRHTRGLGDDGLAPDGSLRGVGWRSIFAVAVGAQYRPTDSTSVRVGYSWNQNPVPDARAFVNVASPTILTNAVYAGASWDVTPDLTMSVAYMHAFENSVQGTWATPLGPVPGTSVRTSVSLDSALVGMSVKFGAGPDPATAACGTASVQ